MQTGLGRDLCENTACGIAWMWYTLASGVSIKYLKSRYFEAPVILGLFYVASVFKHSFQSTTVFSDHA